MTNEQSQKKSAHRVPPYKRPIVIAVFLILVIITAVATVFLLKNSKVIESNTNSSPNQDSPSTSNSHTGPSNDELQKVVQYEGEDPNDLEELTGSIPYKGIDTGILTVNVTIDQYLTSEGSCELILTNDNGEKYTANSRAVADITSSICESFNVPVEDLTEGHWNIEVLVKAEDKKGTIKDSDGVDI